MIKKRTPRASNSSAKTYSPPSAEPSIAPMEPAPSLGYTPPPPVECPPSSLEKTEVFAPSPPPLEMDDNPSSWSSPQPSPKRELPAPINYEEDEEPLRISDAPRHPDLGYGTPDCFIWCWQNLSRDSFRTLYAERRQEMREKCRGIPEAQEALSYLKPQSKPLP